MSFECMAWAVKQRTGDGVSKSILLHLADRTNHDTGMCIPRIKRIAEDSEYSEKSVKRALVTLKEKGFIEIIPRHSNGVQISNAYVLKMPLGQTGEGGVTETSSPGQDDLGVGSGRPTEPVIEPGKEPSLKEEKEKTQPIELPEDFKPSRKQVEFAKKENLNIDACLTNMKRWAIGKRRANWTSVFNKFLEPGRFNQNVLTTAKPSFTPYKPISNEPIVFED